jgi:predicted transglutaminase-like cysteine proteinase
MGNMRRSLKRLGATGALALCALCCTQYAQAAFYGLPRALKDHVARVSFAVPSLAPMAFTRFCLKYRDDCEVRRMLAFRRGMTLTAERWAELVAVNRAVNRAIVPQRNEDGLAGEAWLLSPAAGDCNDYAVTKRHELLARGWPSHALVLTEVVIPSGEHHLVLVVRTRDGDFVLDNLSPNVRSVSQPRYRWVRAQSPRHPNFWSTVTVAPATVRTAMADR